MCIHVYTTGAPSALKFLKQAFPDAVLDSFNPDMPSGQVRFPVSSDDAMRSGWYESEMIDGGRSVFFRFGRARPLSITRKQKRCIFSGTACLRGSAMSIISSSSVAAMQSRKGKGRLCACLRMMMAMSAAGSRHH